MTALADLLTQYTREEIEQAISSDPVLQQWTQLTESGIANFRPRVDRPELYDEQYSFVYDKVSMSFLVGGNAAGTTVCSAYKTARFLLELQPPPRRNTPFWIISNTYDQVCGVCWAEKLHGNQFIPDCEVQWDKVRWLDKASGWPSRVPLKPWPKERGGNPNRNWIIEFKSYEQGRTALQARSIGGFWFSEQFPLELLIEVLRGTREYGFKGGCMAEFTPIDPTLCLWVEKIQEKPPPGWRFYRCNTECNRENLAEGWIEEFFAAVPDEMVATRKTGELASFEGVIYESFNRTVHVVGDEAFEFPNNVTHYRGVDWGFSAEHPFACYDDQTEVLTENGWKKFADTAGDRLATVNTETKRLEFQLPTSRTARWHDGEMYLSEPRVDGVNFCVTPEHRMVVQLKTSKRWQFRTVQNLVSLRGTNYVIPARYLPESNVDDADEILVIKPNPSAKKLPGTRKEDFARFLGLWIAEGDLRWGKRNTFVRITQKCFIDEVRNVVAATGWRWNEYTAPNGVMTFSMCSRTLGEFLALHDCDKTSHFKTIPRFVFEWGEKCLRALLEGLCLGDGTKSKKAGYSHSYSTTSGQLASDVQELASRLGLPVIIKTQDTVGFSGKPHTIFTCRFVAKATSKFDPKKVKRIPYRGMVYCATVPNGTLIVRRGGKNMVCGNCVWGYVDGTGRWFIYDEYWNPHSRYVADDHALAILDRSRLWGWPEEGYQDSRYRDTFADPSRPDCITAFSRHGIVTSMANNNVLEGIDYCRSLFKIHPVQGQQVFIHERCVKLIEQLRKYRWRRGRRPEENPGLLNPQVAIVGPLKRDDDMCDGFRYMVFSESRGRGRSITSMSYSEWQNRKSLSQQILLNPNEGRIMRATNEGRGGPGGQEWDAINRIPVQPEGPAAGNGGGNGAGTGAGAGQHIGRIGGNGHRAGTGGGGNWRRSIPRR